MRSRYNIFWLDDEFLKGGSSINTTVSKVKSYMESKGFECVVEKFMTFEEGIASLEIGKKVDLFISDYNIGGESKTGLDFLKFVRSKYRKEMVLYSNNDVDEIKNYIVEKLDNGEIPVNFFSKFTFYSAIVQDVLIRNIEYILDETLVRWEELNALRGLFLAEISQREENLKRLFYEKNRDASFFHRISNNALSHTSKIDTRTANELITLKTSLNNGRLTQSDPKLTFYNMGLMLFAYNEPLFRDWEEIRTLRNGFAHISENTVEGTITLKNGTTISETDIYTYRVKLLKFLKSIDTQLFGTAD